MVSCAMAGRPVPSWDGQPIALTGKRLVTALGWIALAMVATLGLLWVFQRNLIYLPTRVAPEPPPGVEEIVLETGDGLHLAAWLVPAEAPSATVIVFNGNAGNRSARLPLGMRLAEQGYTVLLTDYRGYGGNPGSPSEDGLALDARAVLEFAVDRFPSLPLIYFGESLGAGVAIGLAAHTPPDALILRSPFASLPDIAAVHYPWVPASLLLRDEYQNVARIPTITTPVLVIAGSDDRIVPIDQSRAVYGAANEPKSLLVIDGARHNDPVLLDGEEMISGIIAFLDLRVTG